MKNTLLLALVLCLLSTAGFAQKKLLKKIFSNEQDTTRGASFLPVPILGYSQETGFEFGLGGIYAFYADQLDTNNRSSNFTGSASYSTKNTYNFKFKGDAWTQGNDFHLLGEIGFKNTRSSFYGIGNQTLAIDEDKFAQRQIKLAFDAEKAFLKNAYTGVSLGFESYRFSDHTSNGIFNYDDNIIGKNGGDLLLVGISQSYDTRNSNNYPTKGFFGRLTYQYAPPIFGSDNFTGSQFKANIRNFWSLTPSVVLGVQAIYHTVQSSSTPFYVLPQLGNDELMRGYYSGRFRDENLIATQAEIRYRFIERLGVVAFVGTGKVFHHNEKFLKDFKPNYGVGGRFFFDPAKGLSVRLDYGVGEKPLNEKRQTGFYISLAEAF